MVFIKNIRLSNYDYQESGFYFVTIVTDYRKPLLAGKEELINRITRELVNKMAGLSLDYFVVMPDHLHVIFILENCNLRLGEIVRRLKAKVSRKMRSNIWQPNFYEHVIRNDKALTRIREYITNNPEKELLKFDQFYL